MTPARLRALTFVLALAVAACTISGCGTAAAAHRDPNTLVVVYYSDPGTLNPLYVNTEPGSTFNLLVLEPLAQIGPDYSVKPWLATSWSATPDHLHWRVRLRRGVTWSDGAPFDARDVVFTWKMMLDPQAAFLYAGMFAYVTRVVAESPYVVRFDCKTPNVLFPLDALGSQIMPAHLLARVPASQQRLNPFGQRPIGTGPYVLQSWHHDESMLFTRNTHYWGGVPKIARVQVLIVLDGDARVNAMADGSGDVYPHMSPADYRELRKQAPPHVSYLNMPDLYERYISVNTTVPGLDDVAVRQAMMYGWDRQAVVDGIFHGDVTLDNSIVVTALTFWHDNAAPAYHFDPVHAQALLDAAGWKRGSDGIRVRGATRLAFALLIPTGDAQRTDVGAEYQADMRKIGIAIQIQMLDYATFIDRTNNMEYQLNFLGWGGTPDPDQYTLLDSTQGPPTGNNEFGYKDARADRDLAEGLMSFDPRRRRMLYDDLQMETGRTLPILWGYDEHFEAALAKRLHIERKAVIPDQYFFWNVATWSLSS